MLFADDFSDPSSGWWTGTNELGEVRYEGGELHLLNYTGAAFRTSSEPGLHFTDTIMEVQSRLVGGSDDNWHSHSCRVVDDNNYYSLSFSADGYYMGMKVVGGERTNFVSPTRSGVIRQGTGATNVARLECVGSHLRLRVNGTLLIDVTDTSLSEGDIGLGVTSLAGEYSEVAFDNLLVSAP